MKTLVNVYVPAIARNYDVLIPSDLRLKIVTPLVAETIETMSNHLYVASGHECLCSVEKNIMLRKNFTLESYGIQNGDHLIVV